MCPLFFAVNHHNFARWQGIISKTLTTLILVQDKYWKRVDFQSKVQWLNVTGCDYTSVCVQKGKGSTRPWSFGQDQRNRCCCLSSMSSVISSKDQENKLCFKYVEECSLCDPVRFKPKGNGLKLEHGSFQLQIAAHFQAPKNQMKVKMKKLSVTHRLMMRVTSACVHHKSECESS